MPACSLWSHRGRLGWFHRLSALECSTSLGPVPTQAMGFEGRGWMWQPLGQACWRCRAVLVAPCTVSLGDVCWWQGKSSSLWLLPVTSVEGKAVPGAGSSTACLGRDSACVSAAGTGSAQTGAHWSDEDPPSVFPARKVSAGVVHHRSLPWACFDVQDLPATQGTPSLSGCCALPFCRFHAPAVSRGSVLAAVCLVAAGCDPKEQASSSQPQGVCVSCSPYADADLWALCSRLCAVTWLSLRQAVFLITFTPSLGNG